MSNRVVHFEIQGKRPKALQDFYSSIFGWQINSDNPMNYGLVNTQAGAGINGGIDGSEHEPSVVFYVEVDDPQAHLDRAQQLGGKIVTPVTVIPNMVTYAEFTDPAGNRIGLVKRETTGKPVVHWEINGSDGPALWKFYSELFGWNVDGNNEWKYGVVSSEAGGIGGGIGQSPDGAAVRIYVEVPDPQAALDQIEKAGGQTLMPVTEIPGAVTLALFADPDGNVMGLIKGS